MDLSYRTLLGRIDRIKVVCQSVYVLGHIEGETKVSGAVLTVESSSLGVYCAHTQVQSGVKDFGTCLVAG